MAHHTPPTHAFRSVPKTGVIYVMSEARRAGYQPDSPVWANLGQGAPETGPMPGAPDRIRDFSVVDDDHEYAPVAGLDALRDAVAELYNQRYRKGRGSQYTRENVAISAGGRLALTRLVATLGRTNVGHFLPDYTAYEELLGSFGTFVSIPITLPPDRPTFRADRLRDEILDRGLSVVLLSNPCNPTGRLVYGEQLQGWVDTARTLDTTLIFDEFYAHYTYVGDRLTTSAAEMVEDVDRDPVVIVDGLTKNWRYPGWRVSWTIGPKDVIERVHSAGSFLDGGCARRCRSPPSRSSTARSPTPRRRPSRASSAPSDRPWSMGWHDSASGPRRPGQLLLLGRSPHAPRGSEHRHGPVPGRARREDDLGAGGVLRHQPGPATPPSAPAASSTTPASASVRSSPPSSEDWQTSGASSGVEQGPSLAALAAEATPPGMVYGATLTVPAIPARAIAPRNAHASDPWPTPRSPPPR